MSLKPHLDADSFKVYFVAATSMAVMTWNWNAIISGAVGLATLVYITIKIIKQLRDWKGPDNT